MSVAPPPSYAEQDPLLITPATDQRPNATLRTTDPAVQDLPDDFKYSGITVHQTPDDIRRSFVQKVYAILSVQLLATTLVALSCIYVPSIHDFVQSSPIVLISASISSLILLLALIWKRKSHPTNMYLLSAFTLGEAYTLGTMVSFYDQVIVLQALVITAGITIALTMFAMTSGYNFSFLGPFLFVSLCALLLTSLVQIFIPFSTTFDLITASISAVIFSGYIIYDTDQIMNRVSVDGNTCIMVISNSG